jgi:hypothetical protein
MKNTNLYKGISIVLIIIFFAFILNINQNDSWDKVIKVIEKDEYHGIITDKFIDKENHNDPTIILSSGKKISLYGQQWDKMKIGDSLSKKLNTTTIEVFKKDKVIQIDLRAYIEHLKKKMK